MGQVSFANLTHGGRGDAFYRGAVGLKVRVTFWPHTCPGAYPLPAHRLCILGRRSLHILRQPPHANKPKHRRDQHRP